MTLACSSHALLTIAVSTHSKGEPPYSHAAAGAVWRVSFALLIPLVLYVFYYRVCFRVPAMWLTLKVGVAARLRESTRVCDVLRLGASVSHEVVARGEHRAADPI